MSVADHAVLARSSGAQAKPRRGLLAKYTIALVSLVIVVLAINGIVELWITYGETMARAGRTQRESADAAGKDVVDFLDDAEREVSWATRASSTTLDRRRQDYEVLLKDVPAIAGLSYLDGSGQVQLDVSRPDIAQKGDGTPGILEALNHRVWYGPPYLQGSDAFMSLAVAHSGANAGSTVARLDLRGLSKLLDTRAPPGGYAFLVDSSGLVLAASETSPVEVAGTVKTLSQTSALTGTAPRAGVIGWDPHGRSVVSSGSAVPHLGWTAVVEQPTIEVLQPVLDLVIRLAWLLALGLLVASLAGLFLARRMTRPLQALHIGAAKFAENRFDHRVVVETGDELEALAQQLNRMAAELAASYGQLEAKVEERTRELAQSVRELEALEEIGRAVASSLELKTVLDVVVTRAIALTQADAAAIFIHDPAAQVLSLAESRGLPAAFAEAATSTPLRVDAGWSNSEFGLDGLVRVGDLEQVSRFPLRQATIDAGFRSILAVALQGAERKVGILVLYRRAAGDLITGRPGVVKTLAGQSVLAMHNARLFREVADKGTQIEIANAHRTLFFANMSHELRTPLNAVLGYSELLSDGIYGEIPDKALGVLERIQTNGKHLLSLINDVLDLTKMEAGALTLSLNSYSLQDLVASVVVAAEPLAGAKSLALTSIVPPALPLGYGDDRRLTQALLNLVGNAIKFTQEGSVTVDVSASGGWFNIAVRDTGPGIPAADLQRIFEEFHQIESEAGRKTTGTGLGLSISRRLVAMHGGTIEVESRTGRGSAFTIVIPIRADQQRPAA